MHPALWTMIQQVLDQKIPFKVNRLYELAGLPGAHRLPKCGNCCYRWMLGLCEPVEENPIRCRLKTENTHPTTQNTPDKYVRELMQLLQLGVKKLLEENKSKKYRN